MKKAIAMTIVFAAITSLLSADEKAELPQGVTGKVIELSGNFQPMIVPDGVKPPVGGGGGRKVLNVPVHIFKGKVEIFEKPDAKHAQFVAIAKPDKNGVYRWPLEPGEYTAVAEINGKLYLNLAQFDSTTKKAVWATFEVKPKEWTTFNIEDTSKAAF